MADQYVIDLLIEKEKQGRYYFTPKDKIVLNELLDEINSVGKFSHKLEYITEILDVHSWISMPIAVKYIEKFESELARANIARFLRSPQVEASNFMSKSQIDKYYLDLYMHFKNAIENQGTMYDRFELYYIANIYDNGLYKINSKKLALELVKLANEPIEFYSLCLSIPRTALKWKIPDVENIAYGYLTTFPLNKETLHIDQLNRLGHDLEYAIQSIKIFSFQCLSYFPNERNANILTKYSMCNDELLCKWAKKHLDNLKRNAKKQNIIV